MAESVGAIYYTVEADTAKLLTATTDGETSLDNLERQFKRTDKAASQSQFQMTKTAQAVRSLGRESSAASSNVANLARVMGALIGIQGVRGLIEMAEAYNEMAERVRMATSSTEEYELVQSRLLTTANKTYRALSEAQEVYILTADSVRSLGYNTEQALDITDSLSYSFVKNATSVDRANSAVSAFTKALNKGKVEADGWESLIAAVPTVVNDIATAAGKTSQEIRELGVSGGITAQMLTEGLRGALDENKAAADGMATTLKDAFRNLSNNLSVYVGEANNAYGATGLLSSSIIALGENIDFIVKALSVAGAGALAKYIAGLTASSLGNAKAAIQARIHAAEQLKLAIAEERTAAAAATQTAATARLGGAHSAAAVAAARHTAAQTALSAAQRAYVAAGGGLLTLLGGPAGIIALVASAAAGFVLFGDNARNAVPDVNSLTNAIDKLGEAQLRLRRQQAEEAIEKVQLRAQEASDVLRGMERDYSALSDQLGRGVDAKGLDNATRSIVEQRAEVEQYGEQLNVAKEALSKINEEIERRGKQSSSTGGASASPAADPEVKKRLQDLREELALSKLQGVERAKLAAVQKLGAGATAEERAEAEKLAEAIYRNSDAQKSIKESTKASIEARKKDREVLADMARELQLAALSGEALAVAKAKNQLSSFATPQQIADLERMAKTLYEIDQKNQQRKKFGDTAKDADQYIMGDVSPLSGGAFDDQVARYDAEAQAEQKRYAEQLERLTAARELQIQTQKSYDQLEQEAAQQHADRMAQIEQAKNSVILSSASDAFGAMADILRQSQGEQSGIFKAMFAASKAFAIADATVNAYSAISKAWNSAPFPANLAAVAATTPQVMSVVSAISAASYGGRQYGGSVDATKMYRVNENGAPEILNTASGRQYLLPNSRGEVVSNKEATGGKAAAAPNIVVNVHNAPPGTRVENRQVDDQYITDVILSDFAGDGPISNGGKGHFGWKRRGY
ncbi:tape measure protein [Bordetella genomosp. 4]|uniref:Tape measure protein N-terminal domain-containing protein n=1 Tax=Bordetella genomosp. 4 TaxID=463044 RepID=A0A261U8D0_9BORD|nr:tape measure protein [Bordetella genomosp. 4]OZI57672.1 hypothetical protein CAL20_09870 [Bordetella genomosp. 4]